MSKAGHPKLAHQIARGQLSFQDHEPHPQASCHHPTCCLASGATCQLWHSLSHPPVLPSVWKHSSNLKQGQDKTLTCPVCVCVCVCVCMDVGVGVSVCLCLCVPVYPRDMHDLEKTIRSIALRGPQWKPFRRSPMVHKIISCPRSKDKAGGDTWRKVLQKHI